MLIIKISSLKISWSIPIVCLLLFTWFSTSICQLGFGLLKITIFSLPIGSMYAIYGDMCHQYTPNVSIYTSTMDPMGYGKWSSFFLMAILRTSFFPIPSSRLVPSVPVVPWWLGHGADDVLFYPYGYGSIPISTIFRGMNIHLPAILMFTRGTRFWHTAIYIIDTQCVPNAYFF